MGMGDEGNERGALGGIGSVSGGCNGQESQAENVAVTVGKRKSKEGSKAALKKKVKTDKAPTLIPAINEDVFETPEDEPGSIEKAEEAFQWLVGPTNLDTFYKEFWKKKPLHLKRDEPEYYSTENTREFKEVEEQSLEVGIELAPAVEHLIGSYPKWTKVEELPVEQLEERMKVVGDLWERGILMTSEPLEAHYDDP